MNDGPTVARQAATTGRREIRVSPWVRLFKETVEFARGARPETYHRLAQANYVAIFARTPDGLIPIVRQFRPAVESYTWEMPAGLVDPEEDPTDTCRTSPSCYLLGGTCDGTNRVRRNIRRIGVAQNVRMQRN